MRRPTTNAPVNRGLSWWIVLVAGLLVVLFTVAITRELIRSQQVRRQVERLEDQVAAEESRQEKLTELISYLSSQTYQEREARLKLGLKKAGEKVVLVPPDTVPPENDSSYQPTIYDQSVHNTAAPDQSNPQKWWKYFFNFKSEG